MKFLTIFGGLLVLCVGYCLCLNPHTFDKAAGAVAQAQAIVAQPAQPPPQPSIGTSVVGGPSLSAAFINQVLSNAGSPAAGQGDTFYSNSVKYGIDDAWALAFYQHESTFGLKGEARSSLSIGNLRCVSAGYEDLGPWCPDGYTHWPSWQAGIEAWYRLIRNVYVDSWGCSTVE
ncbi:MAG TPA: hypothetical protein VHV10_15700, partial [Ktedonobacteraceae bacterium]|nr:hypothetical protein [Ktedonobacteraceae bacterium]